MEWQVWEVGPERIRADQPPDARNPVARRWLCFESATERRRLATFPRGWLTFTLDQLDALCRAATPSRPFGASAPASASAAAPTIPHRPRSE